MSVTIRITERQAERLHQIASDQNVEEKYLIEKALDLLFKRTELESIDEEDREALRELKNNPLKTDFFVKTTEFDPDCIF